jgi:hypothetical protein
LRTPIFISYSRKDAKYLNELKAQLASVSDEFDLDVWDDSRITIGEPFREHIERALDRARIGILLVSSDFLNSEFVRTVELPRLIPAARAGRLRVCIIHVRPSLAARLDEIGSLQSMNDPAAPLSTLPLKKRESAWVRIVDELLSMTNRKARDEVLSERGGEKFDTAIQRLRLFCLNALDLKSAFQFVGEQAVYSSGALDELNLVVRRYNGVAEEILTRGDEYVAAATQTLLPERAEQLRECLAFAVDDIHRSHCFRLNEARVRINRLNELHASGPVPPEDADRTRRELEPCLRGIADKVPILERKLGALYAKVTQSGG